MYVFVHNVTVSPAAHAQVTKVNISRTNFGTQFMEFLNTLITKIRANNIGNIWIVSRHFDLHLNQIVNLIQIELGLSVDRNVSKNSNVSNIIGTYFRDSQLRWPSGKSIRLENCRLGFDSESGQTNNFKIGIHSFPAWRFTVYLLRRWERHLAGFPPFGVVDRWPATPKRTCIAHWLLSRDRRMNMRRLKIKKNKLVRSIMQSETQMKQKHRERNRKSKKGYKWQKIDWILTFLLVLFTNKPVSELQ